MTRTRWCDEGCPFGCGDDDSTPVRVGYDGRGVSTDSSVPTKASRSPPLSAVIPQNSRVAIRCQRERAYRASVTGPQDLRF